MMDGALTAARFLENAPAPRPLPTKTFPLSVCLDIYRQAPCSASRARRASFCPSIPRGDGQGPGPSPEAHTSPRRLWAWRQRMLVGSRVPTGITGPTRNGACSLLQGGRLPGATHSRLPSGLLIELSGHTPRPSPGPGWPGFTSPQN